MKKFIFPLCILALSAGFFTSCDDDDDDNNDNGSIVINQNLKNLVYSDGQGGTKFEYDSKGRCVKSYSPRGTSEYTYNGNTITGTSVTEDWNEVLSGKLNSNGFFKTLTSQDKISGEVSVENYTYDKDGHVIKNTYKINSIEDNYAAYFELIYVWENGDLVSCTEKSHEEYEGDVYDEERNYSFKYTNDVVTEPIENKACIPLIQPYLEGLDKYISLRNFVGVAGKHLPVSIVHPEGQELIIDWTFDADGYPINVSSSIQNSLYSLELTWE